MSIGNGYPKFNGYSSGGFISYPSSGYLTEMMTRPAAKPKVDVRKGDTILATTEQKVVKVGQEFDYAKGKYLNYAQLANGISIDLDNDTVKVKLVNRPLPKADEKFKGAELHLHSFPTGTNIEADYGSTFIKRSDGRWSTLGGTTYGAGDLQLVSSFKVLFVPAAK